MFNDFDTLYKLKKTKLVAVIRGITASNAIDTAIACIKGKIMNIEIACTTPHVDQVISKLSERYKTAPSLVLIGAGTVLDPEMARIAIISGAKFIVSPSFNIDVAKICNLYSIPYIPGCFSPTEVQAALEIGVDVIKIFPSSLFGENIITELQGPFPQINIMPSGGVNLNNLSKWLDAGAFAVGIGGSLVKPALCNNYDKVTENAKKLYVKCHQVMA